MCCPWGLRIEFKKIIGIALVVVDLLFPNAQSRPSLVRGKREGAEDAFLCRPLNSLLHHLLQCEISGTARRRREREREREGTLYCPFAAPGEKENYLRDGHESRRGSFPKLAPPDGRRADGRDGENSNYASGARKLNGREWHHGILPHKKDAICYPFCFPTTPPKTRRTWDREESLHHKMECKIFVLAAAASATLVPSRPNIIPFPTPSRAERSE